MSTYKEDYELLKTTFENFTPKYVKHVIGRYIGGLCPYLQFIRLDALEPSDYPNNIDENSVYIEFKIDFQTKSVEVFSCGHIWLSAEEQKATYLAMSSIKNVCKGRGVKWFRKQSFKDVVDLYTRIKKFYENAMDAVNDYTQGYPYKHGIGWVDKTKNQVVA